MHSSGEGLSSSCVSESVAVSDLFPLYEGIAVMFSEILSPKLVVQELRVQKEALEKNIDKLANDAASKIPAACHHL